MHSPNMNIKVNEKYCVLKSGSCSPCLRPFSSDTYVRRFMSDCLRLFKGGYELLLASDPRNCRTSWLKTTFCSLQVLLQAGVTLFRELTRDMLAMRMGMHVGHAYRNRYWWVTLTIFECIDKFYQDSALTDFLKIHLWFLCCYVYTDKQTD